MEPWRAEGPKNLTNIQGSHLPNSGVVHPNKEEIGKKFQETCAEKYGTAVKTQRKNLRSRGGREDRWPRRNTGKLYGKLGMRLGKLRPT